MQSAQTICGRILRATILFAKICLLSFLFCFDISVAGPPPPKTIHGKELRNWFKVNYFENKHSTLTYNEARVQLYNYVDNKSSTLTCVYSGYGIDWKYGGSDYDPSPINCEHTVPQSLFNYEYPMKSDIHHLFPVYVDWNSTRQNYPFAELSDADTAKWMYLDTSTSEKPTQNIELYSKYGKRKFEPRRDHKGNVARAVFYFFTMYDGKVKDIGLVADKTMLARWNVDDPVDDDERIRNDAIESAQGNRNPYIDYPDTVERAFDLKISK
ncbi:MAG: endonuclease [Oligoflexales bacterium]|nr:endonuclease [Oligoflexales bacterium]